MLTGPEKLIVLLKMLPWIYMIGHWGWWFIKFEERKEARCRPQSGTVVRLDISSGQKRRSA
ncbi:hypothetical protein [Sporosarcina trichiuri]|uniref:hypothetical protein n=1 Tax=Sporosarcina trichiuri TaxID=3056445 RepID=UPI0025B3256D|nr:hypothetical protein [Sporosarcina sp. 0.2-SM1T-5]WJY27420.1 hypothetical protein QWT68_15485 [Sporosarcina sp. 0.2-SM1T-5]WJY27440.1 hypothetical protein QWT68_00005 [Sporosarcina sp. 0.2-SM1T-5]